MAWFKIDDGWWSHPKTLQLSDASIALWARAGSWSCQQLTDGRISVEALGMLRGKPKAAEELVRVGYWDSERDGWRFHDWDEYQEHSDVVKKRRSDARERMRTVRANRERTKGERSQEVRSTPTRPDPTRPTSTDVEVVKPRKRASRIPEPFIVTRDMRAWAGERTPGVDVNSSTEKFVNHWRAKGGRDATKLDWVATWHNWLITDFERSLSPTRKPKDQQVIDILEQGRQLQEQEDRRAIG